MLIRSQIHFGKEVSIGFDDMMVVDECDDHVKIVDEVVHMKFVDSFLGVISIQ